MKINKFKKVGKNKYKIFFDYTDITLYEDIILKYDLLIRKDIDEDLIDKILTDNSHYDAYYLALNYIEIKMRNKKEIINYLKKKEFSDEIIDETIDKLESLNLLNSNNYIVAFVNDKVNLGNDGPYKIKKELLEYDYEENDIDNYLNTIDESIWKEKLEKIVNKKKSLMKSKSYYMFVSKMKNDLYNMGYDKELIEEVLSNINYESDALNKDYNKAIKKYSDKNKIINYLLRKGYSYEDINNIIKND